MTGPLVSDFEVCVGMLVIIWIVFGVMLVHALRQDTKIVSRFWRYASRALTCALIFILLAFFTGLLVPITMSLGMDTPTVAHVPGPPDGWWKCGNR